MGLEDLLRKVRPSTLVDPDEILNAIDRKVHSKDTELNYRGALSKFSHPHIASLFAKSVRI